MKLITKIFLMSFFVFYPGLLLSHGGTEVAHHHMMGAMFGSGGYGFFGMGWIMIIFWLVVITGVIGLIKWVFAEKRPEIKGESALDILKERYAKGEINEDEYKQKKKDLINS